MMLKILFWIALLIFISYVFFSNRKRKQDSSSSTKGGIILWLMIFSALIVVYAFRFELESVKNRVLAVLIPSYSWTNEQGQLVIARSQDGHFYVNVRTPQGQDVRFLVDTGASDIALTKDAAQKFGFSLANLKYTQKYSTANGVSYAAPVRIKKLTIGKKAFYNQGAHITSGGLDVPLLGMSVIGEFDHFKITQDMLILSY